jgi:hypothetical protein
MSKEGIIIEVDRNHFWINLDNPKEVSYQPKEEGNWKSIQSSFYGGQLLSPNGNEISYKLKTDFTRGYLYKIY